MPTKYLYVLSLSQKKIEDFPMQHSTISFCSRGDRCLLRGTNRVFKWNGFDIFFKWL